MPFTDFLSIRTIHIIIYVCMWFSMYFKVYRKLQEDIRLQTKTIKQLGLPWRLSGSHRDCQESHRLLSSHRHCQGSHRDCDSAHRGGKFVCARFSVYFKVYRKLQDDARLQETLSGGDSRQDQMGIILVTKA